MSKKMGHAEIIREMIRRTGITKEEAKKQLDLITDIIMDGVADGNTVMIYGFGKFGTRKHAGRKLNMRGIEHVDVDEMTVAPFVYPYFTAGKPFKDKVREKARKND